MRLGLIASHPGGRWVGRDWIRVAYAADRGWRGRGGIVSALALGYFGVWGGGRPKDQAKKKGLSILTHRPPALISMP